MLERGWSADLLRDAAAQGWFSLAVPEEVGGLGIALGELAPVFVALGEHLVPGPLLENVLLPALFADTAVGERLVATVERGGVLAMADPGISCAWSAEVGRVRLTDRGLSGSIGLVRFAAQADLLLVVADAPDGPHVCLVEPGAAGLFVEELDSADPGSRFARVTFDECPAGQPLAAGAAATELVGRLRAWARLLLACELAGIARHLLTITLDYVQQRKQFGRVIGSYQVVQHTLATMHASTSSLHNLCLSAAADAGDQVGRELEVTAAAAKAYASETARQVSEDALQMHGGIGFTAEHELHWYYKRALAARTWYGDERELELEIGRLLILGPDAVPPQNGGLRQPAGATS
ncbi:Acyl-CoA dehydrogenase [Blastococcus tunisiensis]|uniref:Acyl-CoA dehydrogenase n=2 Tax=Blastococcus tunisiensis TaxID=1798228 RepID=A0A1I2KMS2_9ACTN|nr:Acyl-CoA dehydrogenase [Blastococcus sp. DSM 46838]